MFAVKLCLAIFLLLLTHTLWAGDLIHVNISVNGVSQSVPAGGDLEVFRGDTISILSARTEDKQDPDIINLVGFRRPGGNNPFDDTDKLVLVGRDLNKDWSQGGKGKRYRVNVRTESKVHGRVFVKVKEPLVESITINVNGKTKVVRPNGLLELARSDDFSLKDVKANFDVSSSGFKYQVIKKNGRHEIVLSRYKRLVATFPIKVH